MSRPHLEHLTGPHAAVERKAVQERDYRTRPSVLERDHGFATNTMMLREWAARWRGAFTARLCGAARDARPLAPPS
jgi:hypothetical protein